MTAAAASPALRVARVYLRVSTVDQDLERQERIIEEARGGGYYVAGVYREKASGAKARCQERCEPETATLNSSESRVRVTLRSSYGVPMNETSRFRSLSDQSFEGGK